ncbi:MAG TPA: hypothetical protein VKQ70_01990 [Caulobacteraceae bacterium]|jgi:hypothetical protein|nr:hypothetical protein [Caulobacteraceae bacterium]
MTTLSLRADDFEPVYGWLEQHGEVRVEVWGLENGRRAALLAYGDGPPDGFSWSNWISATSQDPSECLAQFPDLEVALDAEADAANLKGAFPAILRDVASA